MDARRTKALLFEVIKAPDFWKFHLGQISG